MVRAGIVVQEGLIAHGRGEAFDYILGERTWPFAQKAVRAAAAAMLTALHPVISVNGNVAALAARDVVRLSRATGAKIEVNLFHRSSSRERAIAKLLRRHGAGEILGLEARETIEEVQSHRRRVDPEGILIADVVLVPLEDGDRTEALVAMGKTVIAVDLNPLSRTSMAATISIVDNILRCLPRLIEMARSLRQAPRERLLRILRQYDNSRNLKQCLRTIAAFLRTR